MLYDGIKTFPGIINTLSFIIAGNTSFNSVVLGDGTLLNHDDLSSE